MSGTNCLSNHRNSYGTTFRHIGREKHKSDVLLLSILDLIKNEEWNLVTLFLWYYHKRKRLFNTREDYTYLYIQFVCKLLERHHHPSYIQGHRNMIDGHDDKIFPSCCKIDHFVIEWDFPHLRIRIICIKFPKHPKHFQHW